MENNKNIQTSKKNIKVKKINYIIENEKNQIVKKLMKRGVGIEGIIKATGLSEYEVKKYIRTF